MFKKTPKKPPPPQHKPKPKPQPAKPAQKASRPMDEQKDEQQKPGTSEATGDNPEFPAHKEAYKQDFGDDYTATKPKGEGGGDGGGDEDGGSDDPGAPGTAEEQAYQRDFEAGRKAVVLREQFTTYTKTTAPALPKGVPHEGGEQQEQGQDDKGKGQQPQKPTKKQMDTMTQEVDYPGFSIGGVGLPEVPQLKKKEDGDGDDEGGNGDGDEADDDPDKQQQKRLQKAKKELEAYRQSLKDIAEAEKERNLQVVLPGGKESDD